MASQEIMHNLAVAATNDMRQHFRNLWNEFIFSVAIGRPYLLLPRYMGDQLGNAALESIMTRFAYVTKCITYASTDSSSILSAQHIYIQLDPTKDAYVIGPHDNLPNRHIFRILKVIYYKPTSMIYPPTPAWTPPARTEFNIVAASTLATSDTALVRTNKAPKPANSFILYRRDKYAELCAQHPNSPNMPHKEFCK